MDYYLGINCSGTFIKAALFDEYSKIHCCEREHIAVISEQPGYVERDIDALWQVCAGVIRRTVKQSEIRPHFIRSIGIPAQGKGAFLPDKHNRPLGQAVLSSDQRSLSVVRRWQADGLEERVYQLSRQNLWSGHPVSVLRWLKENEP